MIPSAGGVRLTFAPYWGRSVGLTLGLPCTSQLPVDLLQQKAVNRVTTLYYITLYCIILI